MIRGKGAAAACAIVLNEEQFEACCGGINGKVNNHCCMEPTPGPLYTFHFILKNQKNSKIQEILAAGPFNPLVICITLARYP